MEYDRSKLNFHERQERVWVVRQSSVKTGPAGGILGVAVSEAGAGQLPGIDHSLPFDYIATNLFRPSLAPIYGGPTLLEALWSEMDRLMEALMTGTDAEDDGDKFRAQELAWVLAIVSNAYDPSVDRIRAEAMERWYAEHPEDRPDPDAEADEDDAKTRPEGADQ
jgi:hypothetical protein